MLSKFNQKLSNILIFLGLLALSISNLYPLFYMFLNSIKSRTDYLKNRFSVWGIKLTWENYQTMISQFKILTLFKNSFSDVEKFDEKKPTFWDSLPIEKKKFLHALEAVIYDFAGKGNIIIVGRGGQVLLRDLPGVLHARVIAPFEIRLKRILAREGGDEKKAARTLHQNDRDSAGFLRSFFDVDWDDYSLYDLILNTEKMSAETGVKLDHRLSFFSGNPGGLKTG